MQYDLPLLLIHYALWDPGHCTALEQNPSSTDHVKTLTELRPGLRMETEK